MRSLKEIKACKRIAILEQTVDGFSGIISMPLWTGTVICSYDFWDHVSVAPSKKRIIPSWDDMCMIKDIFFKEDEAVIQIHPPKNQYVNNMPNCLHLWRWNEGEMILPPSFMVGMRVGQTIDELNAEIKAYYKEHGKELRR
jgi:hypothetical protein